MRYFFLLLACLVFNSTHVSKVYSATSQRTKSVLLKHIPQADSAKIIRKIFPLTIPGYPGAYNPSIVKLDNGFLLSFRYDDLDRNKALFGLVRLNKWFKVVGQPVITDSMYELEDMRLFWYNDMLLASGTHLVSRVPLQTSIALSQVDIEKLTLSSTVDLKFQGGPVEKNWSPLVHADSSGTNNLFFIYSHNPFHMLRLTSLSSGAVEHVVRPWNQERMSWERHWGLIRGGTPVLSVGNERLEFFHSSFDDKVRRWWVIGAMTFENTPPFHIKKISPYPIMAEGMYSTPLVPRFKKRRFRVAFPGGFVEVYKMDRPFFYLVYGENDSGIKVMVIDKKRLLASLKKAHHSERPYHGTPYRGS